MQGRGEEKARNERIKKMENETAGVGETMRTHWETEKQKSRWDGKTEKDGKMRKNENKTMKGLGKWLSG